MAQKINLNIQGSPAGRLVGAVIVVGLGAGAIMLATFGLSIYHARSNQATINKTIADVDHLFSNVNQLLSQTQREMSVLLTGRKPLQTAAEPLSALPALREIAADIVRSENVSESFDELYAALLEVKACDREAWQWFDRQQALEAGGEPAEQRVDAAISQIRERLESASGRERLERAMEIRKLRAVGSSADPKLIDKVVQSNLGIDFLPTVQKELDELALLIEEMKDAPTVDRLSDLRDNQIHPAVARLRRQMSRMDESAGPGKSNLALLNELVVAVFGDGAWSDDEHQTIQLGANGLFRLCQQRLASALECKALQVRISTVLTAAESARRNLASLDRARTQSLTTLSTDGFEHAWWSTLSISLICCLLFVALSVKTASILRRQFREVIAATNSAQASEQRVRQVINASLDAVITMNERGIVTGWNARAEKLLGRNAEDAEGLVLADVVLPQKYRREFLRRIWEFIDTGRDVTLNQRIEAQAMHRNGSEIPVDLAIVPLRVGEQFEFNVFLQDITQRKQNEYAITRVLAESTSLAEAAPRILAEICALHQWDFGALWLVDAATGTLGCIDIWHDDAKTTEEFETATRHSNFSLGMGLPGRAWSERHPILVPDLAEESLPLECRERIRGSLRGVIEFPIVVGRDVLGVIEMFSSVVRDADDEMLLTLSTVASRVGHFIEREQAEQSLRQAEAKSRGILDAIPDIAFLLDAERRVVDLRVPAAQSDVYSSKRMLGNPLEDVFPRTAAEKILSAVDAVIGTGDVQTVEYYLMDGNNKGHDYEARVAPMAAFGCLVLARDVSDRKRLQMQLSQAQKLESIGQLAAGIAHEINTPIQYIGDNTRFLQDSFAEVGRLLSEYEGLLGAAKTSSLTAEQVAKAETALQKAEVPYLIHEIPTAIEQSLEGIDRVATIVRAMKNFSHPDAGDKHPTDLNHCIENTILVARNEWKYVADVTTDFDPELPLVACLAGEFNQVVLNLIVNAAHAIADAPTREPTQKGTIRLSTRQCGEWVEIRVGDNGGGIPEAIRGRMFDPFFTTKEVGRGTGQGLAIAYAVIVERHRGTISFETEVGRGTTFIVRLPIGSERADQKLSEMAGAPS